MDRLGLPLSTTGAVVTAVAGPARATGLRPGDVVTAINGTAVEGPPDVDRLTSDGRRSWAVEFLRNGQRGILRLSGG